MKAPPQDLATRARLLQAAKSLFAERGFEDVTVRDICKEAGANLALVNYHFGDKHGLYMEVVNEAIARLTDFNTLVSQAPEGSTAEQMLTHFVRVFLTRVLAPPGIESWVHKIMQHEIARPTAAAPLIGRQAVAPRIRYLGTVVAELLGLPATDPRVARCVASVHGLCLGYLRRTQISQSFRESVPELVAPEQLDLESQIEHVVTFSIAGIRAVATGYAAPR